MSNLTEHPCTNKCRKQIELLQTEVARLNSIVERQKAEMVVMQARIDELTAENAGLHQAATTHFRNQNHYMDLYNTLVMNLYPYALDLDEPVSNFNVAVPREYLDGYNRSSECISASLLEMMKGDEGYIKAVCGILVGEP